MAGVNADITCDTKDVNADNGTIFCFYKSQTATTLDPKLKLSEGLSAKVETTTKSAVAGMTYTLKIIVDVDGSKPGDHTIEITQGNDNKKIYFKVVKIDETITYNIEYKENYAEITLNIPNADIRNKVALVKVSENSNYNVTPKETKITLYRNKVNQVKFRANYVLPDSKNIKFRIQTSDNTKEVTVPIYKQNIGYEATGLTPLFTLSTNTRTIIVLDIILFIVAIVLFTMFIGRLGKFIVKSK